MFDREYNSFANIFLNIVKLKMHITKPVLNLNFNPDIFTLNPIT